MEKSVPFVVPKRAVFLKMPKFTAS